ncbi:uncharacterized protein EV154DRAFT_498047 [Mucor mucedo]|uniref:uncharacterized protein n=1 Tax=Mucor mucedo TaxID=29922 RepID=UPI00221F8AB5|nr:uncharacterized protein EV154DRAFT_498047 [Mucor mucedo]KAI7894515.1 hypothetical protein EV154DRAFT_498047 [Mucor mucedo]
MAKKTANTKVEAANNRKASSRAEKEEQKRAEMSAKEDAKWAKGAKKNDKKELEAEKKAALALKKQEAQRILAEEEKNLNKPKAPKPNYMPKKTLFTTEKIVSKKTIPTTLYDEEPVARKPILTEKDIEKHPERRFKNALKEYEEREIKNFRSQYPGLRLSQLKEIMYKEFQKSADNPFNQTNVFSYNSTLAEVNRKLSKYLIYLTNPQCLTYLNDRW